MAFNFAVGRAALPAGLLFAVLAFTGAIANASGVALFTAHCAVCHQTEGQGIPGMYPPLADSIGVFTHSKDGRAYLVHVVSFGLNGPIDVHGTRYNGYMQSWAQFSDDDIAQLLNYVLKEFDSKLLPRDFKLFTAEEVKHDRSRPLPSTEVYRELEMLGTASVKADAAK